MKCKEGMVLVNTYLNPNSKGYEPFCMSERNAGDIASEGNENILKDLGILYYNNSFDGNDKCKKQTAPCCQKTKERLINNKVHCTSPITQYFPPEQRLPYIDQIPVAANYPSFDYGGCARTTCNWQAANIYCKSKGMNLASDNQFNAMVAFSATETTYPVALRFTGAKGLQFCTNNASGDTIKHGVPICGYLYNGEPAYVWGREISSTEASFGVLGTRDFAFFKSGLGTQKNNINYSVRCTSEIEYQY